MGRRRTSRAAIVALLAIALLRVAIPVGYMPAPLASGWPVQLCPQGLSAQTMRALFGAAHVHHGQPMASPLAADVGAHQHHHHQHGLHLEGSGPNSPPPVPDADPPPDSGSDVEALTATHCPLGAFAFVPGIASAVPLVSQTQRVASAPLPVPSAAMATRRYPSGSPRAPPLSLRSI